MHLETAMGQCAYICSHLTQQFIFCSDILNIFLIYLYQLSIKVQQDQGIRMRIALGVYIIIDWVHGVYLPCRYSPGITSPTLD